MTDADLITIMSEIAELKKRVTALEEKRTRFKPPEVEDVMDVFRDQGIGIGFRAEEAEKFIDFYTSKNWYVGKTKMKDWRAAARGWVRRRNDEERKRLVTRESKSERASRIAREHLQSDSI